MLPLILVFLISFFWHGLGITVGYHRLLAHRSFRCPKAVEYFLVLGGYLAMMASPAWWATVHRAHHKHAETGLDPHSPTKGYLHSYFGWLFVQNDITTPEALASDLMKDPVYRFIERAESPPFALHLVANILFRVFLFYYFGWQVCLVNVLAAAYAFQVPLLLNFICHLPNCGYRRFATPDHSVNVRWMGILALGEGWHNNHHAFPGSARMGFTKREFDLSFLVIKMMQKIGLVTQINDALKSPQDTFKEKQIDFCASSQDRS
jgi:stearoyl-CoA desaturase (delta-9 desaturase)